VRAAGLEGHVSAARGVVPGVVSSTIASSDDYDESAKGSNSEKLEASRCRPVFLHDQIRPAAIGLSESCQTGKAHGEHFETAAPLKADPSLRSSERKGQGQERTHALQQKSR
jgi:hypothetical protein